MSLKIKIIIALVIIGLAGSIAAAAKYYYDSTQETIATLRVNNANLETAIEQSEETVNRLERNIETVQREFEEVQNDFREARQSARELRARLADHELGFLAKEKPGLVEPIINRASKRVMRCFEILSGAPLTDDEKNASKPSEINTECPDIANPNYENDE